MRKIVLLLVIPCLVTILLLIWRSGESANPNFSKNQKMAQPIISALGQYYLDHQRYPVQLEDLSPAYLDDNPESIPHQGLMYRADDHEGYYLCFSQSQAINNLQTGCCHTPDSGWECSPGE